MTTIPDEITRLVEAYGVASCRFASAPLSDAARQALDAHAALLAAIERAIAAPAIPDGWKLMPVEATGEMLEAGRKAQKKPRLHVSHQASDEFMTLGVGYRAMLAAAPEPPAPQPTPPEDPRDMRPADCRFRLRDEGRAYPRSSCRACGATIVTGLSSSCRQAVLTPAPQPTEKQA